MAEATNGAQKVDTLNKDSELEAMFQAGVQFGYSRSRRHPSMSDFIHGFKNNIEIFDLEKTREALEGAENFLRKIGEAGKNVLWVGTKPSTKALIEKYAKSLAHSYVAGRWIGGTLTNAKIIRDRIKYFDDLKKKMDSKEEKTALSEARRMSIPVIAILSSDNDLSKVAHPIPGNDSASSSLDYLLGKLAAAYQDGVSKSNLNSNG